MKKKEPPREERPRRPPARSDPGPIRVDGPVKVIVGLGNPGKDYEETRHNLGFRVVDFFARDSGISTGKKKFFSHFGSGRFQGEDLLILKPTTFMNRSGSAVSACIDFYRIDPEDLVVAHDDVDLDLGRIRLRRGGGDGGHKGVRSVIQSVGSRDFIRVRLGVGRPVGREPVEKFVLRPFRGDDMIEASNLVERAAKSLEVLLIDGLVTAMNQYNPATYA